MFSFYTFTFIFFTVLAGPGGKKAIIGYWGSAADKPTLEQLPEALKRGYNVISLAFGDTIKADGSFGIHTNLGFVPKKSDISKEAGIEDSSWEYILSFGGQNAAGPYISDVQAFANGFLNAYGNAKSAYGFDGIDIDIETGMTTPLLKALRIIFYELHSEGEIISMAPQPSNIDPQEVSVFMEGSWNCYVPLIDTTIIDTVTYVATQMYNNGMPLNDMDLYLSSMQSNKTIEWDGKKLIVEIPSEKFCFGYPAANGAAPAGASKPWGASGAKLMEHYRGDSALLATGGVMTWSIGWDASNGWDWITNVMKIWNEDNHKSVA